MTTITASDLKQNTMRLQDALREDMLVTKRNKPFVVVMDYEKYKKIEAYMTAMDNTQEEVEDDGYPTISLEEANTRVADAVAEYRSGKGTYLSHDEAWDKIEKSIGID